MKTTALRNVVLIVACCLAACGPAATPPPTAAPTALPAPSATAVPAPTATAAPAGPWWQTAVFYEIFVRSFKDSDGDGIGDFNGITAQLDYLQQLGITALWLMPIHPSPSYHGYDVTDYYGVNADYGTLDDFKNLLAEAHQRGIKIIIDLVLNHTSARHPWFQKAVQGDPAYRDWYIWSDKDPGTLGPWNAQAWYRASNGLFYYAIFWDQMPDLNYDNPAVRAEVNKITAFWLQDMGIDGFRLDAIRYLDEDGRILADAPTTHAFLKEWGAYYRSLNPEAFTVGEVWTSNSNVAPYTQGDELTSAFNFDFSLNPDSSYRRAIGGANGAIVNFLLNDMLRYFPQQNNANFLTNHDMNRAASLAVGTNALDQGKLVSAVLFTLPGIPFVYYGEEIGMTGMKPDERLRTPMQWTEDPAKAGFTTGIPWEALNADVAAGINVAAQTGDPNSLLEHYRRMIALRHAHPALQTGATSVVKASSASLVAYLRQTPDETVLVVANLNKQPVKGYTLTLAKGPLAGAYQAGSLLDAAALTAPEVNEAGGFAGYAPTAEIPAYGFLIIQLQPR